MTLHRLFVTLGLPAHRARLGGIAVGAAFVWLWRMTLGMQTLAMALFALSIVALFEVQKFFNRTQSLEGTALPTALGAAYAQLIALSVADALPTLPYASIGATLLSLALFALIDRRAPSTVGWLRRRLANGFGEVLAALLAGIAAGLGAALALTLLGRAS